MGFPGGSGVKNSPANAGDVRDVDLTPQWGRCLGEGNGNLLEFLCLENSMERGAWSATVHGSAKSQIQLSMIMMHCITTEDKYLLHFIWIKPCVLTCTEKIGKNKVKIIL